MIELWWWVKGRQDLGPDEIAVAINDPHPEVKSPEREEDKNEKSKLYRAKIE